MNWFSLGIASRYTLAGRQSHLVAFISRVSTIGLVLAVSILITVLSVMNGFDRELRERILAIVPHASLTGFGQIENWPKLVDQAQQFPGVVEAAPFSQLQTLVMNQQTVRSALLYGIDPDYETEGSLLRQMVGDDALQQLSQGKHVIIGSQLAARLSVASGDTLKLILPARSHRQLPTVAHFVVTDLLHSGTELDQKLLLTHRTNVALLNNNSPESVDGIRIRVEDLFAARTVAMQLADETGLYQVLDWSRTHGNLYHAVQMSRKLVLLLVLIIITVAAFNVVSTLVLAVNDKAGDIAILRTMGCNDSQILTIFLYQGLLIGLIGVSIGVVLGVGLSMALSDGVAWLESLLGIRFLQTEVYPIDHLPSEIHGMDIAVVAGVALLLSVMASLFPAWLARHIEPASVLRYE